MELQQLETRDCPSAITLIASGQWSNPSIWSTDTVPTQNDDVTLTGNNFVQAGGTGLAVHSLKLASAFTGDLFLYGALAVNPNGDSTGGLEMDNGTIDQPGGANAPINVDGGYFNWYGGVLNSTTTLASLNLLNVTATVSASSGIETGSDFNLSGAGFVGTWSPSWTFNNKAGINLSNHAGFEWHGGDIVAGAVGIGTITNNGGTFETSSGPSSAAICRM